MKRLVITIVALKHIDFQSWGRSKTRAKHLHEKSVISLNSDVDGIKTNAQWYNYEPFL